MTLILGIETSCDETAAAVVADGRVLHSSVVASQVDLHRQYGGVFPEMASRQHVLSILPVIDEAMVEAIHKVGHVMKLQTIAEFVESEAIAERLRKMGVDYAQGYGVARPKPFSDVLKEHGTTH